MGSDNPDRESVLNRLTVLDFMAVDLALYLDTHPDDKEVIEKYNSVLEEAEEVRCEYEKLFGPLCSFRSESPKDFFKWIECPWPWTRKFNYFIEGEEC